MSKHNNHDSLRSGHVVLSITTKDDISHHVINPINFHVYSNGIIK